MTEQEAIDYLKNATVDTRIGIDNIIKTSSIINISIEALEKQIPKKPVMIYYEIYDDEMLCCPNCKDVLTDRIPMENKDFYFYCYNCGQKLDWSE